MRRAKYVRDSETVLSQVMMPLHANHYGNVHGGMILRLVDEAAFVTATKHARRNVVLASMDHIVFRYPVRIGDLLTLRARILFVGRSSMDVEVEVETERLKEGRVLKVGSAYLTMVALDHQGAPARVPRLILKNRAEKLKSGQVLARRKKRLMSA